MRILVVIPTYNERENLRNLVPEVLALRPDLEVLVVDDGSPDGTGRVAEELGTRTGRVHLLERAGKQGLGSAYREGFRWALGTTAVESIVQMDADFSHDPKFLPEMLRVAEEEGVDLVLGSRYLAGANVVNWPIRRLLLSYWANWYARIVTGMRLKDSTGGFKVFRRRVLESIDLSAVRSDGYGFQIEMNFHAWKNGHSIREMPIVFVDRHSGTSKMDRKIIIEAFWLVWKLRFQSMLGWKATRRDVPRH